MKRLLIVLETDRSASAVVRGLAYRDLLVADGHDVTLLVRRPVAVADRVQRLPPGVRYIVGHPVLHDRLLAWASQSNERRILEAARTADVVFLVKVGPYKFVQEICRTASGRVVYDLVDAKWLSHDARVRNLNEALRQVHAVTTDNEFVAEYVRRFNSHCVIVPDTTPLEKFDARRAQGARKPTDRVRVGWIGGPDSAHNLFVIWEALEELWKRHPDLELRLVGTGQDYQQRLPRFERVNVSTRAFYSEAEMIDEVLDMHIGLFPLHNVERSRARGVLKAVVYMSGEAAVVASPVGQCVDIIQDGVNGMLAATTSEWIEKLERLITSEDLRRCVARKGLETVRSRFQRSRSFEILRDVLFPAVDPSGSES